MKRSTIEKMGDLASFFYVGNLRSLSLELLPAGPSAPRMVTSVRFISDDGERVLGCLVKNLGGRDEVGELVELSAHSPNCSIQMPDNLGQPSSVVFFRDPRIFNFYSGVRVHYHCGDLTVAAGLMPHTVFLDVFGERFYEPERDIKDYEVWPA